MLHILYTLEHPYKTGIIIITLHMKSLKFTDFDNAQFHTSGKLQVLEKGHWSEVERDIRIATSTRFLDPRCTEKTGPKYRIRFS